MIRSIFLTASLILSFNASADLKETCRSKAESLVRDSFKADFSSELIKEIYSDDGESFHPQGESFSLKAWNFIVSVDAGYALPSHYKVSLQERGDNTCILRSINTDLDSDLASGGIGSRHGTAYRRPQ